MSEAASNNTSPYWAVVQTHPQRESNVRIQLMRAEFETYMPRIRLKAERTALLFPTYVFVRVVERWYPICSTIGVVRVLMSGEQPARLPDREVAMLRKNEVGGFVKLPPPKQLRRGQQMRIVRGSFEGHLCLFDGMSGPDRQRVLLALLGQIVPVELPKRDAVPL